jgi:hypothetical protein
VTDLSCRHCGRPIVAPASKCPWCGETIMVICASCKAYTDDQELYCSHCREPLQPDPMERVRLHAHHPELARMVADREHAQLVASTIVLNHVGDFFYEKEGFQTTLVKLFGSTRERGAVQAGVIFSAYAYLCQRGYCTMRVRIEEDREQTTVSQLRPWDGQQSVEEALAEQAARAFTTSEVTEKMLRGLMVFRMQAAAGTLLRAPKVRDAPARSAFSVVDQLARMTELPDHDQAEACRTIYGLLSAFVEGDSSRARVLAAETKRLLCELDDYA